MIARFIEWLHETFCPCEGDIWDDGEHEDDE